MGGMVRRWIIRVPLLLALGCVLTVWITSYFAQLQLEKWTGGRFHAVGADWGVIGFGEVGPPGLSDTKLRFAVRLDDRPRGALAHRLVYFRAGPWGPLTDSYWIAFPLWLPALVLAGLNWLVWRKTRVKGVGRAFPVEAAREGDAQRPG